MHHDTDSGFGLETFSALILDRAPLATDLINQRRASSPPDAGEKRGGRDSDREFCPGRDHTSVDAFDEIAAWVRGDGSAVFDCARLVSILVMGVLGDRCVSGVEGLAS
ncbi:MAG: hypothetical protein IIB04_06205 [Acidobacteria bacterium]|nr:hypothetical protein [Acidobacteriota bacterium]